MPLPVSHSLVGASVIALLLPPGTLRQNWLILLFGAFLANSPDFDFFFVWVLHIGVDWHRSFTHSVFFTLAVTCLILLIAGFSRIRFVLAYAILDFLTTTRGGGVELLFPFSSERLKLGVFSLSEFEQGFYISEIIKAGLVELLIFTPIFLAVLWLRDYFSDSSFNKNNL
jgi:hypothetical protein